MTDKEKFLDLIGDKCCPVKGKELSDFVEHLYTFDIEKISHIYCVNNTIKSIGYSGFYSLWIFGHEDQLIGVVHYE